MKRMCAVTATGKARMGGLLSQNEDKNFLNLFMRNEDNIIGSLYRAFADFYEQHPEKFYYYYKRLTDDWQ